MSHTRSIAEAADVLLHCGERDGVSPAPATMPVYRFAKRLLDMLLGTVLLIVFAPAILLAAVAIKLTSAGPALLRRTCATLDGGSFVAYSLRCERSDGAIGAGAVLHRDRGQDPLSSDAGGPGTTRIGRLVRGAALENLPQLLNVVTGRMSLVGPPPLLTAEARRLDDDSARLRMAVKPGLTCLSAISRGSEISYEEWVSLDLFYVRHRTMLLDLLILIQTIPAVLSAPQQASGLRREHLPWGLNGH